MSLDVLLIVDMQEDLLRGSEKHELAAVVERINRLGERVREAGGQVIYVQHDGNGDDGFVPFTPGWEILGALHQAPGDRRLRKTFNDAFFGTSLASDLRRLGARRVLVCGWATDFCVDATVRSAAALGFQVVVAADCHTVSARPNLSPQQVIDYHHWLWTNIISALPVGIAPAAEISRE